MRKEITVKCSLCGDTWDTFSRLGEGEVCTECGDVFMIHPQDIVGSGTLRASEFKMELVKEVGKDIGKVRIYVDREHFEDELRDFGVRSNAFLVSTLFGGVTGIEHEATGRDASELFDHAELVKDIIFYIKHNAEQYYRTEAE